MQPVIAERVCAGRHRLDALAIAGANQAGDVCRAHPTPRLVTQLLQMRLKPMFEIPLPILFRRQPQSKLAAYESRISPAGNPKNHTSAKVVLGAGYMLRGENPGDCTALALAAASRHPGVAVAIAAHSLPDAKPAPVATVRRWRPEARQGVGIAGRRRPILLGFRPHDKVLDQPRS